MSLLTSCTRIVPLNQWENDYMLQNYSYPLANNCNVNSVSILLSTSFNDPFIRKHHMLFDFVVQDNLFYEAALNCSFVTAFDASHPIE